MSDILQVDVVSRGDPLAQQALHVVEQAAMVSWVILFGGDRWRPVEYVAVACYGDEVVGLASLAPTDEMDVPPPQIIGVWVAPAFRHRGTGVQLVRVLSEQSQKVYDRVPVIVPVTRAGQALIEAVLKQGIALEAQRGTGYSVLP